jgi:uncharacterized protein
MLDLTPIPVVDNHCHPMYRDQQLDVPRLRRLFTEATSPDYTSNGPFLWLLSHGTGGCRCPQ